MGYSNFKKLEIVTKKFGLSAKREMLFANIIPFEPNEWLKTTLAKAKYIPLSTEKAKSERIVSPILVEIAEFHQNLITLFSGEELEINADENLSGACDFLFAISSQKPYLENPIIAISAQKFMSESTAQCAAQLYGAKLFNEMEGKNIPVLYGCATDGVEWQFMRFENNMFHIDNKIYTDLKEILGVWHHIINLYIEPKS
jgi:hypothetical protein